MKRSDHIDLLGNPLDEGADMSPEDRADLIRRFEDLGIDISTLRYEYRDGVLGIAVDRPDGFTAREDL